MQGPCKAAPHLNSKRAPPPPFYPLLSPLDRPLDRRPRAPTARSRERPAMALQQKVDELLRRCAAAQEAAREAAVAGPKPQAAQAPPPPPAAAPMPPLPEPLPPLGPPVPTQFVATFTAGSKPSKSAIGAAWVNMSASTVNTQMRPLASNPQPPTCRLLPTHLLLHMMPPWQVQAHESCGQAVRGWRPARPRRLPRRLAVAEQRAAGPLGPAAAAAASRDRVPPCLAAAPAPWHRFPSDLLLSSSSVFCHMLIGINLRNTVGVKKSVHVSGIKGASASPAGTSCTCRRRACC